MSDPVGKADPIIMRVSGPHVALDDDDLEAAQAAYDAGVAHRMRDSFERGDRAEVAELLGWLTSVREIAAESSWLN